MLLTILSIVALAAAFAYLLWSIGAQYPDSMRSADNPAREERLLRKGSPQMTSAPRRRRLIRARRLDPADPGVPTRVSVDRGLAQMLISEAEAAGVRRRELARAKRQLARGDGLAGEGRHHEAMLQYGKAWTKASEALHRRRVGPS